MEENTPANLRDFGLSNGFSAMTPKAEVAKENNRYIELINL